MKKLFFPHKDRGKKDKESTEYKSCLPAPRHDGYGVAGAERQTLNGAIQGPAGVDSHHYGENLQGLGSWFCVPSGRYFESRERGARDEGFTPKSIGNGPSPFAGDDGVYSSPVSPVACPLFPYLSSQGFLSVLSAAGFGWPTGSPSYSNILPDPYF